jgi:acetate kinase
VTVSLGVLKPLAERKTPGGERAVEAARVVLTGKQFHEMVHHQSGLLGVSELSPDMRDLLARQAKDVRAAEAVALFCYQAKKWIGAFAAALGGLDTLVFTGGICRSLSARGESAD